MPKSIIIGDIHGRTIWKDIVTKHSDADRFIFIGDYLDTHENIPPEIQLANFLDICEFKRTGGKEVIMLVGNHDFHYWPGVEDVYSGYQEHMRPSFEASLYTNKKLLQMCFEDEQGTIYSHAGFTETFVEQKIGTFSVQQVNDIWKYKPLSFKFYPMDRSHCGDDIHQSCIWVRPFSLGRDSINKYQIVGHTTVKNIDKSTLGVPGNFTQIDCLGSGQYLSCTNGEYKIETI